MKKLEEHVERTLILAKHDAIQRGLVGEIIKRFENRGMKIVACKMVEPTEEMLALHYPDDEEWKKRVGARNREIMAEKGIEMKESDVEFGAMIRAYNMASLRGTPLLAFVFEGLHAVEIGRKIVGHTEPRKADPGTIRGDFSTESFQLADVEKRVVRNLVHASGSKKEAENEIKIWFKDEEIYDYEKHDWVVMHSFD
ncbi:nucleoside-diphosphate kinase [Candidatus Woesearchaeota archaeon]|nr:MAG: nucleoside-diphosphate kinase [Candidatus Woesearchaeota archaeon]